MNTCKDCGKPLVQDGYYKEAPDYKRWVCLYCIKKNKKKKEKLFG